jgi:hypothetical protein
MTHVEGDATQEAPEHAAPEDAREEIQNAHADVEPREAARPPQQHRPPRQERDRPYDEPRRFQPRQPRQRHPDQEAARQHGSAIHGAIQDVEHIINDLKETLEEMEEVLETLELAEREKTVDEREIEQLRRALRGMSRGRENGPRPSQPYGQGQRTGEHRDQRSYRGPENRDSRPRRPDSERSGSEAPQAEAEHHEPAPETGEPENRERHDGYDEPQPS